MKEALKLSEEISLNSATNGHSQPRSSGIQQLESFICRRAAKMSGQDASYCRLLAYEMLFLWNALPSSQHNALITSGKLFIHYKLCAMLNKFECLYVIILTDECV